MQLYYYIIATISYVYNPLCFLPFCPVRQLAQSLWAQVLSNSAFGSGNDVQDSCRAILWKKTHIKCKHNQYKSFIKKIKPCNQY